MMHVSGMLPVHQALGQKSCVLAVQQPQKFSLLDVGCVDIATLG